MLCGFRTVNLRTWFKETSVLKNVNIPRYLKVNISSDLHVFVDAAGGAYAALLGGAYAAGGACRAYAALLF
ncbi:hypothetical protein TNCV_4952081 [Trichonephila clavipes]|nr:hypothetical protein TNCV_4952081 [Trichonephila clavipes]